MKSLFQVALMMYLASAVCKQTPSCGEALFGNLFVGYTRNVMGNCIHSVFSFPTSVGGLGSEQIPKPDTTIGTFDIIAPTAAVSGGYCYSNLIYRFSLKLLPSESTMGTFLHFGNDISDCRPCFSIFINKLVFIFGKEHRTIDFPLQTNQWYDIKLERFDNAIEVFIDRNRKFYEERFTVNNIYSNGIRVHYGAVSTLIQNQIRLHKVMAVTGQSAIRSQNPFSEHFLPSMVSNEPWFWTTKPVSYWRDENCATCHVPNLVPEKDIVYAPWWNKYNCKYLKWYRTGDDKYCECSCSFDYRVFWDGFWLLLRFESGWITSRSSSIYVNAPDIDKGFRDDYYEENMLRIICVLSVITVFLAVYIVFCYLKYGQKNKKQSDADY